MIRPFLDRPKVLFIFSDTGGGNRSGHRSATEAHQPMESQSFQKSIVLVSILILALLTGCNMPQAGENTSPTLNVTQAYQTVEARLTQALALTPTPASSPQSTGNETPSPPPTTAAISATPTVPPASPTPKQICDKAAPGYPKIDASIDDDTEMDPGQTFTKSWRLENVGTCTWTTDYALVWFSGERLGAPDNLPFKGKVASGQTVEVSVDMVAPQSPGTYQSNWKLRNSAGVLFGIGPNGSSPFWVRIVVVQPPTATPTPATSTPTPTATSTPAIQASGSVTLLPGTLLDLDTAQINPGDGEDLSYESNAEGYHPLVPQGRVLIGEYEGDQPTMAGCQSATMSGAPILAENLATGTVLCYRTNQGLPGWARVMSFNDDDYSLTLNILTWSLP